jgi:xanthosine utilization system XapX-like protein
MLDDPRKGTAVASLGGGGIIVILTYVLFLLHVDVPAPVVAAITGLLGAIAGFWVHSTTLQEDRAALHRVILARLGEQAPPGPMVLPTSHVHAPMPPVLPPRTSPMGDVRP